MWTVEPEQIWKKPRRQGISGFMRLKNEAEFLDRAIESHIHGLDELVIIYNDCSDETPAICHHWAQKFPEKIKVIEYEPKVVPVGAPESLTIDPHSPRCIANYYNFALASTNCKIAVKVDGDHLAVARRFNRICDRVRRDLPTGSYYSIFGLNITLDSGEIVVYNFYDYAPGFVGDLSRRKGPSIFTPGDHAFYYVDAACWHTVDPIEGHEVMDLRSKRRFPESTLTYSFFHVKGMKADRGTGSWGQGQDGNVRALWISNVQSLDPDCVATVEAVRRHNPLYFRGARVYKELQAAFPNIPVRRRPGGPMPTLGLRERVADLWYRVAYP